MLDAGPGTTTEGAPAFVPDGERKITLSLVAREAVADARVAIGADPEDSTSIVRGAVARLIERCKADDDLMLELLDPFMEVAAMAAVRKVFRSSREVLWHMPQPSADEKRDAITSLGKATARTLMDYPLSDGTLLRDATKALLLHDAEADGKQARMMLVKEKWLRAIAKRLTGKKTVGQVLSLDEVAQLKDEAAK